ncbi:hypothetical protein OV203_25940 [Nannocystis sp. ILAH1]|uniref:hypothetical protein n=1 Tax=unclassified Nannocystis TaxID=2627009 RepID=UPI00226EA4DE|nr:MULTISPECIES: hypothetical protein [unclassified Nannocystis]MCY0990611.1 hypothetical protein [Nannocystis sp. ILAH1]MCY1072182.1 hypothetical protein [Nannocystis sp. RBIL2]
MLFHSASVLAASLVFAIPFIHECDLEPSGGGDEGGDDGGPGTECVPEEDEPECRSCLRIACCDGVQACDDERSCSCVLDCMSDASTGLEACARARCDVRDVAAALEPLTRICAVDESCGGPRICEGTEELPKPQ